MHFIVKKTLDQIVVSQNDYLVKVKRNQPLLLKEMEHITRQNKTLDAFTKREINRGREEKRITKTFRVSKTISQNWSGAHTIIYLKRERRTKKEVTITHSYYLSSLRVKAKEFAEGIRRHWGIENRLHYVKDVVFKEDASKIRSGQAPGILSLIRNLVLNVARLRGENRIKKFIRQSTGNVKLITSYLE